MMSVAAGLAAAGMILFASSFAMFAAGRAFEQVRNSIGYPHLNVKIGATHAGISVGEDGATHQCCEDIALMRTIPGMTVINPADDVEARRPSARRRPMLARSICALADWRCRSLTIPRLPLRAGQGHCHCATARTSPSWPPA